MQSTDIVICTRTSYLFMFQRADWMMKYVIILQHGKFNPSKKGIKPAIINNFVFMFKYFYF